MIAFRSYWITSRTALLAGRALGCSLALFLTSSAIALELQPFRSDGCSAFPDGKPEEQKLWQKCCVQHDMAYWKGGTYAERKEADLNLRQCVAQLGEPSIGLVMLLGVRVGGSPIWPTDFRWGYGWPYPKAYGPLTPEEQKQIADSLAQKPRLPLQSLDDVYWFAPWNLNAF